MADTQQQIADLTKKLNSLQTRMGEVCGEVAELNVIMAPFIARYQQLIWPFYESLAKTQREIADIRGARGDKSAISAGEANSPLDRFFDDMSVQEQYERAWSKTSAQPDAPSNVPAVPDEVRQLYAEVVGHIHPELTEDPEERERRRQLMVKVDEAYGRRDQASLESIAEMYRIHSNLPSRAPEDALQSLRDRVTTLEVALDRIEGQKFDLRHGIVAKIKAAAEHMWKEQKRDLLTELSRDIQRSLETAKVELDNLRDEM